MNKVFVTMSFDNDVARDLDVNSAIILQNIVFWIAKNEANQKHFYEGRYWTYNSIRAFSELFNWLSEKQINNCLAKLIKHNYLTVGNFNKTYYDRTKWYSVNPSYQMGKSILPNGEMDLTKRANGFDQMVKPIPYINTYINTDEEKQKKSKEFLTNIDKETIDELVKKFNCNEKQIRDKGEVLLDYVNSKGKKYSDYKSFLRNAIRRDFGIRLSEKELKMKELEEIRRDYPGIEIIGGGYDGL